MKIAKTVECCKNCMHTMQQAGTSDMICGNFYPPQEKTLCHIEPTDVCNGFDYRYFPQKRYYIETPRLVLRKLYMEDAEEIFDNWASDDVVTEYLTWETHRTIEDTKRFLQEDIQKRQENTKYRNWGIVIKEIGQLIGTISVSYIDKRPILSWAIGHDWWGHGYVPEAAGYVLAYLFELCGEKEVFAYHLSENKKSGRVMQKIGMSYIATLPHTQPNEVVKDWYSIRKEEYEQLQCMKYEQQREKDLAWFQKHQSEISQYFQYEGYAVVKDCSLRGYYHSLREAMSDMRHRKYVKNTYIIIHCR